MNALNEKALLWPDDSEAQLTLLQSAPVESTSYLQDQIITYIGNKRSLLPFIGKALEVAKSRLGKPKLRLLDLFSGSGVVARYFKQHAEWLACNDLEDYSRIANQCYLSNRSEIDMPTLREALESTRERIAQAWQPGFISELYAPKNEQHIQAGERVFYSPRNALYLDTARRAIGELPVAQQYLLLAPLIAKASVHANTSGVFKGFYKSAEGIGQFGGSGRDALSRILAPIELCLPLFSRFECPVEVLQGDAASIVKDLPPIDVAYLDPPYNQHPYGSNYFMLNLLANYQRPVDVSTVSGIPMGWNRSRYNQRQQAADALFEVVHECKARFVLISYNSEGFIAKDTFLQRLGNFGSVTTMETSYNTFRGSRNLANRPMHVSEYLYLLEKK